MIDSGVPNLEQFDVLRYRGGEPADLNAWKYLQLALGISRVVQLDPFSEGNGELARSLGIEVFYHPVNLFQQVLVGPNDKDFRLAVDQVVKSPGPVFVHCRNGWDRTGLAVGCYRLWYGEWTKEDAYDEMLKMGFHWTLLGLSLYWAKQ